MNPTLLISLIVAAVFVLLFYIFRRISSRRTSDKLCTLMNDLYLGRLDAVQGFPLTEAQAEQLYSPFTEDELRRISQNPSNEDHSLNIESIEPRLFFWGIYYYHVSCTYEIIDEHGLPMLISKECYKIISFGHYYRLWKPLLRHVDRQSKAAKQ